MRKVNKSKAIKSWSLIKLINDKGLLFEVANKFVILKIREKRNEFNSSNMSQKCQKILLRGRWMVFLKGQRIFSNFSSLLLFFLRVLFITSLTPALWEFDELFPLTFFIVLRNNGIIDHCSFYCLDRKKDIKRHIILAIFWSAVSSRVCHSSIQK